MIFTDCLERLQAGECAADCLARYGQEAAPVAPLLDAAARLQRVNAYHLTDNQRDQAKATLRAAMLSHNQRLAQPAKPAPWRFRLALPAPLRGMALAGTLALVLFMVVSITTVAASQPGDIAYPVRALVERAPVLFKTTPAAKTTTELRVAERRLADIEAHLADQGELAPAAVDALLAGDEAAAGRAGQLSEAERLQAAAQVAAHAATLATLAQSAEQPAAKATLQATSARIEILAQRLMLGDEPAGAGIVTPRPTAETTALPSRSPVPGRTATPTSPATPTPRNPQPTRSPQALPAPLTPGQRATVLAQTATAAPETPGSSPTGNNPAPGLRATTLAQTAPPPTPRATHTPGPGPHTPAPGRRATALAQTPSAMPTATETPSAPAMPPAHGADTPGPGRRATAQAQSTATPPSIMDPGATPIPPAP